MYRTLCKSKITKALVTGKELHYDGSIGIDKAIVESVDLIPGEQVDVLDVNNGARFTTYVIEEKRNSGKIVLYGPAARQGEVGDEVVILAYCMKDDKESKAHRMRVVELSKMNRARRIK